MQETDAHSKAKFVARMFGRVARRYDFLNTVMTAGMHHQWRRLLAGLVTKELCGSVLDVATGTGDVAFELVKRDGVAPVVGVDLVWEMVALARTKARRRRLHHRLTFIQGDALSLPFDDGSFACVTSGFAMRNVVDVERAMREMVRVARPGGRVAILDLLPSKSRGIIADVQRVYFQRMVPALGTALTGDREAYTYLSRSVNRFRSADNLALLMRDSGLTVSHSRVAGMGSVTILVGEK